MGKLLEVKNLKVQFETSDGIVKALNGMISVWMRE